MQISHIMETALYVSDLAEAKRFYHELLGLEIVQENWDRNIFFKCGSSILAIFNPLETRKTTKNVPTHGTQGSWHMAFGIPAGSISEYKSFLSKKWIIVEKETTWENWSKSLYFRDPSGNSLEFIEENYWFQ